MSARSLGQTYKVDPRGGPSATYVRTYELTKNLQDQGDSLTIRNAREKSDEIRNFSPRMNPRPEGDTMNSTETFPPGTRVQLAENYPAERDAHGPGTVVVSTVGPRGYISVRHDSGGTVHWIPKALEALPEQFDPYDGIRNAAGLEQAVYVAIGAASTCWENLVGAGKFQSERADDIARALLERIEKAL